MTNHNFLQHPRFRDRYSISPVDINSTGLFLNQEMTDCAISRLIRRSHILVSAHSCVAVLKKDVPDVGTSSRYSQMAGVSIRTKPLSRTRAGTSPREFTLFRYDGPRFSSDVELNTTSLADEETDCISVRCWSIVKLHAG
jgi:hypothetical protein